MADTSKVAKNLRAFQIGVNSHDRENPTHTAYGIGLAAFDLERLGFDEGEEILPGITIHADGGVTGNFRVLCDGDHLAEKEAEEAEMVEAVSTQETMIPVGAPGSDDEQNAARRR
ncbi:MAG: hypothetical protein QOE11_2164 [Solirubrobacteraceae bacterium]|jgi:hypothetical protein|nr:hypothetical protein [Solirubrobacteraceae bacterium]